MSVLDELFSDDMEETIIEQGFIATEGKLNKEIDRYREIPKINPSYDPLKFWKDHCTELPTLADFASQYLVVQGSSVASKLF